MFRNQAVQHIAAVVLIVGMLAVIAVRQIAPSWSAPSSSNGSFDAGVAAGQWLRAHPSVPGIGLITAMLLVAGLWRVRRRAVSDRVTR